MPSRPAWRWPSRTPPPCMPTCTSPIRCGTRSRSRKWRGWVSASTCSTAGPRRVCVTSSNVPCRALEQIQLSDYVLGDRALPARAVPGDGAIPIESFLGQALACGYAHGFDLELLGPRIEREGRFEAARRAGEAVSAMLETTWERRGIAMALGDGSDDVALNAAWDEFCDRLKSAGQRVFKDYNSASGAAACRRVPLPHPEPRSGLRSRSGNQGHALPGASICSAVRRASWAVTAPISSTSRRGSTVSRPIASSETAAPHGFSTSPCRDRGATAPACCTNRSGMCPRRTCSASS